MEAMKKAKNIDNEQTNKYFYHVNVSIVCMLLAVCTTATLKIAYCG